MKKNVYFRAAARNRDVFSQFWTEAINISRGQEIELKAIETNSRTFIYAVLEDKIFAVSDVEAVDRVMVLEKIVPLVKKGLYRAYIRGASNEGSIKKLLVSIEDAKTPHKVKGPFSIEKARELLMSYSYDELGETAWDLISAEDNYCREMGKGLDEVYRLVRTDRELKIVEKLLMAFTGENLEGLCEVIEKRKEAGEV